ncbi:hypothetical protein ABZ468_07855 [Streptomyces sp. NPDC005708]|uniref:hypothetical protein n=1 Tax=Streptomyces sp. NPDC005708 TaxID=3154564 RepID=UPI0033DC560F
MAIISFDPSTYYDMTVTCHVTGCRNNGRIWACNSVYSNADGSPDVIDGRCGTPVEILTAVKTDPQPIMS